MPLKLVTDEQYEEMWQRVDHCMRRYAGKRGIVNFKDYDVYWSNYNCSQVLLDIMNLRVLTPRLVSKLRRQLRGRPGWEIIVNVAVDEHLHDWPPMGLLVHEHEVVDELQRSYFPREFQSLVFERARAARPGDHDPIAR